MKQLFQFGYILYSWGKKDDYIISVKRDSEPCTSSLSGDKSLVVVAQSSSLTGGSMARTKKEAGREDLLVATLVRFDELALNSINKHPIGRCALEEPSQLHHLVGKPSCCVSPFHLRC